MNTEPFIEKEKLPAVIEDYKTYLRAKVARRTEMRYLWVVKRFLEGNEPTTENINKFLIEKMQTRDARAAFLHLFKVMGKPQLITEVFTVRAPPKKSAGTYPPREDIERIIALIPDRAHKIAAMIQYDSGRRMHEVIQLHRDNIITEPNGDLLFYTVGKGGKEMSFYVSKKTEGEVRHFLNEENSKEYPFIRSDSADLIAAVNTNCRYYAKAVKTAAALAGLPRFKTHDFRRAFATDMYHYAVKQFQKGKTQKDPIWIVRDFLGHARTETTEKYVQAMQENMKKFVREVRG